MNEQRENIAEQDDDIPLWKRLWPVILGMLISLGLASSAYWLGSRSPDPDTPPIASDALTASGLALIASAPVASAPAASAPVASGVFFQGPFNPVSALASIFGETLTRGSATYARWTDVFLPQTAEFQPFLGAGPLLVRPLASYPVQEAGETRQLLLFQSVPEARPAGGATEGAVIGAAVFRPLGNGWQEVRETRAITAAGAFGQAPVGKPVALGPTVLGLQFEGSYLAQGETVRYGFLVQQDEQGFSLASPVFDLGREAAGCSADGGAACYSYTGQLTLKTTASNGRYIVDLVRRGTRPGPDGALLSITEYHQYRYQNGRYEEDAGKRVLKSQPVNASPLATASEASASAVE